MNSIFLFTALFSLGFLLLVWWFSSSPSGVVTMAWLSFFTAVLGGFFCSTALAIQALLTCFCMMYCCRVQAKPRKVIASAVLSMCAAYLILIFPTLAELRADARLRKQYPLQSISHRLAYESPQRNNSATDAAPRSGEFLSSHVRSRLLEREEKWMFTDRRAALRDLHDRTRDQFVLARGFGPVRMRVMSFDRLNMPETPPVALPPPEPEKPYETGRPEAPLAEASQPTSADLLAFHTTGEDDFLAPQRMGYVRDLEHVAGFESHRFSALPELPTEHQAQWRITRLELISLLKHDTPRAYVSDHLPQMDQLQDAKTRPLEQFEVDALAELRGETDLVADEERNRVRMVGSLRAGNNCLTCHSVREGDLLGAFSYELLRVRPLPEPPQQPAAQLTFDPLRLVGAN